MKWRIDKHGSLKKGNKDSYCPYQEDSYCGDWCPLFSVYTKDEWDYVEINFCKKHCCKLVLKKNFIDERGD